MDQIPRRQARKLLAEATEAEEHYLSLSTKGWEVTPISIHDLQNSFELNKRWKMSRRSDGSLTIVVPNPYATQFYVVR